MQMARTTFENRDRSSSYDIAHRGDRPIINEITNCWQVDGNLCHDHWIFVAIEPNNPFDFDYDHGGQMIEIRIANAERQQLLGFPTHHDNLAMGRPVYYAGTIDFQHGVPKHWDNKSGHYYPAANRNWQAHRLLDLRIFHEWD